MKVYALLKVVMLMMIMTDIQKKKKISEIAHIHERKNISLIFYP